MKIHKIEIENVKSFRNKETIEFKDGLNIFIGPNAGGKSNLMDIVNGVLKQFLLFFWKTNRTDSTTAGYIFKKEPNTFKFDKHYEKQNSDQQQIAIEFKMSDGDIANLEIINSNSLKLLELSKEYGMSEKDINSDRWMDDGTTLAALKGNRNETLNYKINLSKPNEAKTWSAKEQMFFNFLHRFEMLSILIEEYNRKYKNKEEIKKLYSPLLYFSPYRTLAPASFRPSLKDNTTFDYIEDYRKKTSQDVSSVTNYACDYFAEKLRKYGDKIKDFEKDPEVKALNKHIKKLGYEGISFKPRDIRNNTYDVILRGEKRDIDIAATSSGEKEILNLLLGIFAFNVRNGLIIIDEPDLHLHPRWQKMLLRMLADLSKDYGIQFFIVTHSPHFIAPKTIGSTFSVRSLNGTSKVFWPKKELSAEDKDIIQIVNATNNEKIFFADKVVLVEGIGDRIIYERILNILQEDREKTEVLEVVDVKGKGNFKKFEAFLEKWEIKNYIIADLDYVLEICSNGTIKKLFQLDNAKIDEKLTEKGSRDGKALFEMLDKILGKEKDRLTNDEWECLKELWVYIKGRHLSIKNSGNDELRRFIEQKKKESIFILKEGGIEDYFPEKKKSHFDIADTIDVAKDLKAESLQNEPRKELKEIFEKILGKRKNTEDDR